MSLEHRVYLHHEMEEKCENLHLSDKNGDYRKQHSILTCQMKNQRLGCINRDGKKYEKTF